MAEKLGIEANIIDPKWVLSEETGRLHFEDVKCVSAQPEQLVLVEHTSDTVTQEFADRYRRIIQDKKDREM